MEVDSEETVPSSSGSGGGGGHPRTVFARLGHAGLSPLVLGEVHPPPHTSTAVAAAAAAAANSYRGSDELQQLYLNSLYSQHQVQAQSSLFFTPLLCSTLQQLLNIRFPGF